MTKFIDLFYLSCKTFGFAWPSFVLMIIGGYAINHSGYVDNPVLSITIAGLVIVFVLQPSVLWIADKVYQRWIK